MPRSSFVSFHYQKDHWRVQQVLNMGAIEGQPLLPSQDWEKVKQNGKVAIEQWIDEQMKYKAAVIVLVGSETADRPWVRYEIQRAWQIRKPLLGIRIHGLASEDGSTSAVGKNPFEQFATTDGESYAVHVPLFEPGGFDSRAVHASISANLGSWAQSGYVRP